jgi:hypothetical protein
MEEPVAPVLAAEICGSARLCIGLRRNRKAASDFIRKELWLIFP